MALDLASQYLAPVVTGVVLLLFGALVRWGVKVDRALSQQGVVNEKVIGALNVITERLNGHEDLDTSRIDSLDRRVAAVELASSPRRSYSRPRK